MKKFKNDKFTRHYYEDIESHVKNQFNKPLPVYNKSASTLLQSEKNSPGDRKNPKIGFSRMFHDFQDYNKPSISWKEGIIDPGSEVFVKWNRIFLFACILALFVDPLFFYLPKEVIVDANTSSCMGIDSRLGIILTVFRSVADLCYLLNMIIKLRIGFVAPDSRVYGRGDLVMDPKQIAMRYLKSHLFLDLFAALPLPQIVVFYTILEKRRRDLYFNLSHYVLFLVVLLQYIPRLYLIHPLSSQIIHAAGVVTKTAWGGAAYNLLLYLLASHVLGAAWYLSSLERHATCWFSQCRSESTDCLPSYLYCGTLDDTKRSVWANSTIVFSKCNPQNSTSFDFGIFKNALSNNVVSSDFLQKYFYCLWWGLQSLSSYAQSLSTSTFIWENLFAIFIVILGLILFAQLIGNMQTYLQSLTTSVEEWRLKRRDIEQWMRHRQLPPRLQDRVRQFVHYKWLTTRGVDGEHLLRLLPKDLRRDIHHYLCLDLIRRVPLFLQMDNQLQDAICERLVLSLCTQGAYIVREGDPVEEMLFIVRGRLESSTTDGGRPGFFDSTKLGSGDFCGEELLSWVLVPHARTYLPSSTRTVKALTEVEAFALCADDLKYVAGQFKRMHSMKLQHTFRYHSQQWRTWAVSYIQTAWRKHKRRMRNVKLVASESRRTALGSHPLIARRFATERSRLTTSQKPKESDSHVESEYESETEFDGFSLFE